MARTNLGSLLRSIFYRTEKDVLADIAKRQAQAYAQAAKNYNVNIDESLNSLPESLLSAIKKDAEGLLTSWDKTKPVKPSGLTLPTKLGLGSAIGLSAGPAWSHWTGVENLNTPTMRHVKETLDIGGLGAASMAFLSGNPIAGASILSGLVAKDMGIPIADSAVEFLQHRAQIAKDEAEKAKKDVEIAEKSLQTAKIQQQTAENTLKQQGKFKWQDAVLLGALALGAGGLGLYAYNTLFKKPPVEKKKIRVTLPTKQKGDQETVVELDADELPVGMQEKLKRDAKRRLRKEIEERTYRRAIEQAVSKMEGKPWSAAQEALKNTSATAGLN